MSDAQDALLTDVVLRGETAFVGAAGTVLAITLGVFGVLWFFYGFEQGWSLPAILNPALCIIITVAGLGMTLLPALVWYVWEDAMVLRASTGRSHGERDEASARRTTRAAGADRTALGPDELRRDDDARVVRGVPRMVGLPAQRMSQSGGQVLPVPSTRIAVAARS